MKYFKTSVHNDKPDILSPMKDIVVVSSELELAKSVVKNGDLPYRSKLIDAGFISGAEDSENEDFKSGLVERACDMDANLKAPFLVLKRVEAQIIQGVEGKVKDDLGQDIDLQKSVTIFC